MATAKSTPQDKKRVEKIVRMPITTMVNQTVVTYEDQPARIQLDLSQDEALTLVLVGMRIGGRAETTRRGDVDKIVEALKSAGVFASQTLACEKARQVIDDKVGTGRIFFSGR